MKRVLCIGGYDPTTGAGITSDCLSVYQNGAYPLTTVTSITCQNANGVKERFDLEPRIVALQLETLIETHTPDAIKIGMLGNKKIIETLLDTLLLLKNIKNTPIVLDPVTVSTSGFVLLDDDAIDYLKKYVFQHLDLITPNQMEYSHLFGAGAPPCPCLLKGGHLTDLATDVLITPEKSISFVAERIEAPFTHGTGCTLASAIASHLANGQSLEKAISLGKAYVKYGISNPIVFSDGNGAIRK